MSSKDNFAQAMKELLNGDDGAGKKDEKKVAPSSFSSFSQPEPKRPSAPKEPPKPNTELDKSASAAIEEKPVIPPPPPPQPEPAPVEEPVLEVVEEVVEMAPVAPAPQPMPQYHQPAPAAPAYSAPAVSAPAPMPAYSAPAASSMAPGTGDTTVIAPGTVILGDMNTSGGLRTGGDIKGNLKVAGMMELNGKVIGDIEAIDAVITGSTIRGNVTVQNVLSMDKDTTVVGDISARSADVDGKIKGNVTVEDRSHFQSNAILVGNLMSGTIIIDEGATLKGDVAITSATTEDVELSVPDFDIDDNF